LEELLDHVLALVNHSIQYGEDLEVCGAKWDDNFPCLNGGDNNGKDGSDE